MKVAFSISLLLLATTAHADPRALLDKQLASLTSDGGDALRSTLAAGAIVVAPNDILVDVSKIHIEFASGEGRLAPAKAVRAKVIVGTRGDVTWVAAEALQPFEVIVDCPVGAKRCQKKRSLVVSGLVRDGKTTMLHIGDPMQDNGFFGLEAPVPNPSNKPTLAALLTKPRELAKQLLDDPKTVVLGTDLKERAVGTAAAKKLLAKWSKLTLELVDAHENLAAGYVVANVNWVKKPDDKIRMRATMIVVPVDGGHRVAAVHYSIPYERPLY